MLEKTISAILSMVMLVTIFSVYANADESREPYSNLGFLEVVRYDAYGNRFRQPRNAVASAIESASETEYEDIIKFNENLYGMIVDTSVGRDYLYVGKFTVDVMNGLKFSQAMNRNDLTENMIEDIKAARVRGIENDKDEKIVTIFSEVFIPENAVFLTLASRTTQTYNGLRMRMDQTAIRGETAGWRRLGSGNNTRNVMQAAGNITLDLAGFISRTISVFNNARTIYNHFRIVRGLPAAATVQAQAGDFVDVRLTWEQQTRRTYGQRNDNTWRHVVTSRRALIQRSEVDVNVRVNNGGTVANHNMRTDTGYAPITCFRSQLFDSLHWTQGHTNFMWSSTHITNQHAGWRVGNVSFSTQ